MGRPFTFFLFFICLVAFGESLSGMRTAGKGIKYETPRPYGADFAQDYVGTDTSRSKDPKTVISSSKSRGLGISAWGIIAIILSVIVCSIGVYYVIIFYPLVCKKERNYDVIGLSPA